LVIRNFISSIFTNIVRASHFIVGLVVLFLFFYLLTSIIFTINNRELLLDSSNVNMIALIAIIFSLPGATDQFIQAIKPEKIKLKGTMICPECSRKFDIEMIAE
jgi:hypothetical protein